MNIEFLFRSSAWWLPACLLVGVSYSWVLYQPSSSWSRQKKYLLASLRFVLATLLCLLLLHVFMRQTKQITEKKTIVLAIDNSISMLANGKETLNTLLLNIANLKEKLTDNDFDVELYSLNQENIPAIDSIKFNAKTSDLATILSTIKNNFEGRNLADVVLLSDGIANAGMLPTSNAYSFPIHSLALGDTIPKRDITLKSVFSNKIAYLGNQFPIQADVIANGFAGKTTQVLLKQGNAILDKKIVAFANNQNLVSVSFTAIAKTKGSQHYTIEVLPLASEYSTQNNRQEVYLEVIDGKEKILLLALAPHPDIKAISNVIETNDNYELDVFVNGQISATGMPPEKKYDLVIVHQLPDYFGTGLAWVKKYVDANTPIFYILGNQAGTTALNGLNKAVKITANAGQTDKVSGIFNPNFRLLNFDAQKLEILQRLSPLSVPFGEVNLLPNSEVILYQKIGSVATQKPLLVVNTGAVRSAVLLGEGIWQWRMEEYALTEKQEIVDDLLLKTIQFVSAKDDKRKLKVYPTNNQNVLGEKVVFQTEVYNDIFEKLYDQDIRLEIIAENGIKRNYTYTNTAENSRFEVSALPQGIYRYAASAMVLGKNETVTGEFTVQDIQLELANTTADWAMLRQLSNQTGGSFFNTSQFSNLENLLLNRQVPDKISSTEELLEAINLRWLLPLLLLLASIEWVARKYLGGY